ncbi:MAG: hypothetical protein QOI35_10 [Cryptosporangiaceae bacterium]|nr:hypothetical protein [Cryptosporangiaceae bacterium]
MAGQKEGDLSATFGTPARAGLGGLLPRRTPAPAGPAPAEEPPPVSGPPAETAAPAHRKTAARPATSKTAVRGHAAPAAADAGDESESTSQVSVYLLPTAIQAVRKVRARTRQTNAEIAWEAVDTTYGQLRTLISAQHTAAVRPDSLFPARRTTGRAVNEARRTLWAVRATPTELAVVDRLVEETGATSRSELIATAVEAHLEVRPVGLTGAER